VKGDKEVGSIEIENKSEARLVNGPEFGPITLRTRSGDISFVGLNKQTEGCLQENRGVNSNRGLTNNTNVMGRDSHVPSHVQLNSSPSEKVGATSECDVMVPGQSDRGRKVNKIRKIPKTYHHGNKFLMLQELINNKGGPVAKKKGGRKDSKKQRRSMSKDSDPICSSSRRDEASDSNRNSEGLVVEVANQSGDSTEIQQNSTATSPILLMSGVGGLGGSGLRGQEGVVMNLRETSSCSSGGSVDRDRNQAQHVIDILEDVGMQFNGEGEGVIKKIMEFEERDRGELSDWEQRQLNQ
jgi:hypothetical protein